MRPSVRIILQVGLAALLAVPALAAGDDTAQQGLLNKTLEVLKDPWVIFGFSAQAMFMMRFVLQWIASEKRQRSHVPVAFWYFSLVGGLMLFTYAVRQQDPVFMFGQALGCVIYIRNLSLIYRRRMNARKAFAQRAERQESLVDRLLDEPLVEAEQAA